MKWTNERPYEDGYYWLYEEWHEKGKITRKFGPSIVYITIEKLTYGDIEKEQIEYQDIGSDVPMTLPNTEHMITKVARGLTIKYYIKPIQDVIFSETKGNAYPETHQEGMLSIESDLGKGSHIGDVGVQIANDGRIWLCYEGMAFVRFKPLSKDQIDTINKVQKK